MNLNLFIAKRWIGKDSRQSVSKPIIVITQCAVALSVAVMLVAVAVVIGFRGGISDKVAGFTAHVQIVNYQNDYSLSSYSINKNASYIKALNLPIIERIQVFAEKLCMIKGQEDVQTVMLKGVDKDFDWSFFQSALISGSTLSIQDTVMSDNILISNLVASELNLNIGDRMTVYFVQDPIRVRRFVVGGIFDTGLSEFDERIAIIDIGHIQKLNSWNEDEIGGFEIFLKDFKQIDEATLDIIRTIENNWQEEDDGVQILKITDRYNQIFDWLSIIDTNAWIILTLMILVAGINMISGVFIIILQRAKMIGVLKTMGASNKRISAIFRYQGCFLLLKGLVWGNIVGLGLIFVQHKWQIFKLNRAQYFLDSVPIDINFWQILAVNISSVVIIMLLLNISSYIIARISPDKSLRFN